MITPLLELTTSLLIPIMLTLMAVVLIFRIIMYKNTKRDSVYFTSFTKLIEKSTQNSDVNIIKSVGVRQFFYNMIDEVKEQLPYRGVRFLSKKEATTPSKSKDSADRKTFTLRDYVSGQESLLNSIKGEANVFESKQAPNFSDLTRRILDRDTNWNRILKVLPVDNVHSFLEAAPGLFVVMGIFGTFVGITLALPQITNIDFSDINSAAPIMESFIRDITFSMESSICGIFCSLILSTLNAIYPISYLRSKVEDSMEICIEHLWYFFFNSSESIDKTRSEKKTI